MIFFKVELTVVWAGTEAELEKLSVEGLVKRKVIWAQLFTASNHAIKSAPDYSWCLLLMASLPGSTCLIFCTKFSSQYQLMLGQEWNSSLQAALFQEEGATWYLGWAVGRGKRKAGGKTLTPLSLRWTYIYLFSFSTFEHPNKRAQFVFFFKCK